MALADDEILSAADDLSQLQQAGESLDDFRDHVTALAACTNGEEIPRVFDTTHRAGASGKARGMGRTASPAVGPPV